MAIPIKVMVPRLRVALSGNRGFALITVLILTLVITLIGLAFYSVAGHEIFQAQYQRDYAQAFWAAESGLDRSVLWLQDPAINIQPPKVTTHPYTNERIGNGAYDIEIIPDPNNTVKVEKQFTIRSTGRSGRAVRVIDEVVRMEGFTRYGYFTNEEVGLTGQPIWFITGDDIGGKTHTNGVFNIAGTPEFQGPVTTASDYMIGAPNIRVDSPNGWPAGTNDPIFHQGLTLGVDEIHLPSDTGDLKVAAENGGLSLTGDYVLKFNNGTVQYQLVGSAGTASVSLSSLSSGTIHVQGNADVSGIVDGEVTVGASGTINIVGDLLYANAIPGTGEPRQGCDDIVGLVAGRNIIVKDNATNNPGDSSHHVVIDATIMALNTSFYAENYNTGPPKGTINIWGGLIQERRGPVGYFLGNSIKHGYLKDYHYDERVSVQPPPQFPLTGVYSRVSWTEKAKAS